MNIGTIAGLVGGMAAIIMGIIMAQADIMSFVDIPSVFITVVGTATSLLTAFPIKQFLGSISVIKNAFFTQEEDPIQMIDMLVTFSEKARREGLLALEDDIDEVQDEFLKKGIQLVVDGTDPELVKNIMITDMNNIETRHLEGAAFFELGSTIAPAFGMIGTLIGLILMLSNLDDKDSLGTGMAAALITTMYGSVMANWFFIPITNKLLAANSEEIRMKEIMIEGTLSIQSGDNPRVVKDKLVSFLSPNQRGDIKEEE